MGGAANLIDGGKGADLMEDIAGGHNTFVFDDFGDRDQYFFASGDGHDVIQDDGGDALSLTDRSDTQVLLFRVGDDLLISGGSHVGQVAVQSWFAANAKQLETIRASNATLDRQRVSVLVQAMADSGGAQPDSSLATAAIQVIASQFTSYWSPISPTA